MSDAILVTGGAGFIGSHVAHSILQDPRFNDYKIVIVDDYSGGEYYNIPTDSSRIDAHRGSVCDAGFIDSVFAKYNIRYVYHLAAYAAEGLSPFIRRFNYENNVVGSMNVINASIRHEVQRFVFTSSAAVYGDAAFNVLEHNPTVPIDPYGVAKLAVEMDLRCAGKSHGLTYTIFRPHNVYGENQNLRDPYRNVVALFMRAAIEGKPMRIFGDGSQQRQFTYVRDIASVIASCVFDGGTEHETYNIGSDVTLTIMELAKAVSEAAGVPLNVEHMPARDEAHYVRLNHWRSVKMFGEYAATPITKGLEMMHHWAKTSYDYTGPRGAFPDRFRKPEPFAAIEVERGLPPSWQRVGG
jgi:UDP-glucose 4-epimerase